MVVFTMGFSQKDARSFFTLLKENNIRLVADIRLNNVSQLAGYTKGRDLEYFLTDIFGIGYVHDTLLAPTKVILDAYRKGLMTWEDYVTDFVKLLESRKLKEHLDNKYDGDFHGVCFLCSEVTVENCHRGLVVEHIKKLYPNIEIQAVHL